MSRKYNRFFNIASGEAWTQVPRVFYRMCGSIETAVLLAELINLANCIYSNPKQRQEFEENDGWFRCSREWFCKMFGSSVKVQKRLMKEIEATGYVEVRQMGMPCRRHVRIDVDKILQDMAEVDTAEVARPEPEEGFQEVPDGTPYVSQKVPNGTRNTVPSQGVPNGTRNQVPNGTPIPICEEIEKESRNQGCDGTDKCSDFDRRIAEKLWQSVGDETTGSRKVNCNSKIKDWADHVRRLRQVDGHSEETIESVLQWYLDVGREFVNGGGYVVQSGKAFRAKFDAMLINMRRQNSRPSEKSKNADFIRRCREIGVTLPDGEILGICRDWGDNMEVTPKYVLRLQREYEED